MKLDKVLVRIPKEKLGEYKDYVGHLFLNENGVYNICHTEEDVIKSNMWFNNLPVKVAIIDVEGYNKGIDAQLYEQIFTFDITNESLKNQVFFISKIDDESELVEVEDWNGKKYTTTKGILKSPRFIRWNNTQDNLDIINKKEITC